MGLLDRDHYEGNILDEADALEARVDALERTELSGVAGPPGPTGATGATGSPGPGAPAPLTRGDVLVVDAVPEITTLPIGTAHQLLKTNAGGTDPEWASFDWDDIRAAAAADMVHSHQSAAEGDKIDHGAALNGLADDDHSQYYNAARHTKAAHDALALDHGALSGKGDDDHSQYLLASGARTGAVSQDQKFTNDVLCGRGLWVGRTTSNPDDNDAHIDGSINKSTALTATARRNTAQSIPHNSWTSLSWNVQVVDTDGIFGPTSTQLVPNHAGYYSIHGAVTFDLHITGGRGIRIVKNGVKYIAKFQCVALSDSRTALAVAAVGEYFNGTTDYAEIQVWQKSGVALLTQLPGSANDQDDNSGAMSREA